MNWDIFDIIARAGRREALTPEERAFLRFCRELVVQTLVMQLAAVLITVVLPALQAEGPLDVQRVGIAAASAFGVGVLVAILRALAKYHTANGDPALGAAEGSAADAIQHRYGTPGMGEPARVTLPPVAPPPVPAPQHRTTRRVQPPAPTTPAVVAAPVTAPITPSAAGPLEEEVLHPAIPDVPTIISPTTLIPTGSNFATTSSYRPDTTAAMTANSALQPEEGWLR